MDKKYANTSMRTSRSRSRSLSRAVVVAVPFAFPFAVALKLSCPRRIWVALCMCVLRVWGARYQNEKNITTTISKIKLKPV